MIKLINQFYFLRNLRVSEKMKRFATTTSVLQGLDRECRSRVLLASAVFPRSTNIQDEAVIQETYDGSVLGFSETVDHLRRDTELKALGAHIAVLEVLEVMQTMFLDLNLDQVDFVVIQRLGRHVLRLNREGSSGEGRCLVIELNDVRARSSEYILQSHSSEVIIPTIIGVVAALAVIGVSTLFRRLN